MSASRDVSLNQDFSTSTTVSAAPAVDFPIFSVPLADKKDGFWGRQDLLGELGRQLDTGLGSGASAQTLAGTGGVGKSQLAAQVAYRNRERLDVVWWVSCAASEEQALAPTALAMAGLAALGTRLGLPPGSDVQGSAARVREWLEHTDRRWLVIFDDASDGSVLQGLIPQLGRGLVLVTSRNRRWDAVIDVEVLDTPTAAALLQTRSGLEDPVGAERLAQALGGLALALEQAGAFLAQARPVGITFGAYLDQLKQDGLRLFSRGRVADYEHVVATVWDRSFDQVATGSPTAAEVLEVLGALAPAPVPIDALRRDNAEQPGWSPFALVEALDALGAYSLVQTPADNLLVHPLVHRRINERTDPSRSQHIRSRAVALLSAALPKDTRQPDSWPTATVLLPHVIAVASGGLDDPHTLALAGRAGKTLYLQGDLAGSRTLLGRVHTGCREVLGPRHRGTLISADLLAEALRAQGDLAGARVLHDEALAGRRDVLGPGHRDALTSANNLAALLLDQGDQAGAQALLEEVLAASRAVLGPRHPETLASASNLAATLRDQGDFAGARTLLEEVVAIFRESLGPRHPSTLTSANNLAATLRDQGDFPGARALQEEVLDGHQELLGPRHPDTLISASNLGVTLRDQGDLTAARALQEVVLGHRREVLGPRHPSTLTSAHNLGVTLRDQGDLTAARALHEKVLGDRREVLGLRHPDTSMSAWQLYRMVRESESGVAERVLEADLRWLKDAPPENLSAVQLQIRGNLLEDPDNQ